MRCKIVVPLFLLALLGGCADGDYLVRAPNEPSAIEDTASLRESAPHYTNHLNGHPAADAHPEIVRLEIDERFSAYDRAKILRAVNEWNVVLNGFVRLDIAPVLRDGAAEAGRSQAWAIVPARAGRPPAGRGSGFSHALAVTQPVRPIGGIVVIYVDRLAGGDLVGVMRHELGHVLGLSHDPNGRLMSSHYTRRHQQCIDRAAAEAIAANRKLPADELNWCEEAHVASASDGSVTQAANRATR